jgi:hypothetical protein
MTFVVGWLLPPAFAKQAKDGAPVHFVVGEERQRQKQIPFGDDNQNGKNKSKGKEEQAKRDKSKARTTRRCNGTCGWASSAEFWPGCRT